MSEHQQTPQAQAAQGIQPQMPVAQSWLSSLPAYPAPAPVSANRPAGGTAQSQASDQAAQQQIARSAAHTGQPNLVPQLVYTSQSPGNPHSYPATLLAGVQMVSAPQMTSAAMHNIQNYAGTVQGFLAQPGNAAQPYSAQASLQGLRPSSGAPPPVQTAANLYQQNHRMQSGQPARPPGLQQQQHVTTMSPARPMYPQPTQPIYLSEEDRRVLPKRSLKRKAEAAVGDSRAELEPELESALVVMADEFISNAVAFACGLTRRRKSQRLEAADVAGYLDRTWQLHIPGFDGPLVRPYRKHAAGPEHQERTAAVRKERVAMAKANSQIE